MLQRHPESLAEGFSMPIKSWKQTAHNRAEWRCRILEEAQPSIKQRESVKLKERVKNRARVEGSSSESLLLYLQPSV